MCCDHTQWENTGVGGTAAERGAGAQETDGKARCVFNRCVFGTNISSNIWNEMQCCVWTEHLKNAWHRKREEELMKKLMEIVNDRNAIVEGLDEDRLR